MSHLLKQAQIAAQDADWLLLNRCLQQLLSNNAAAPSTAHLSELREVEVHMLLNLALYGLETGDFQTRWDIAKLIPSFGTVAIAPLIERLADNDEDWELTWYVARILGEFQHPEAIAALVNLLKTSPQDDIVAVAVTALANSGSAAIPALVELLAIDATRYAAVQGLAQIQHPRASAALVEVVQDDDPTIRAIAIAALSQIREPDIYPILVAALEDVSAAVRQAAVTGLGLQANLVNEADLIGWLEPCLWDLNLNVRHQAAIALGRVGTASAATLLSQALRSSDTPMTVRINIIRALSWIGNEIALRYLETYLKLTPAETALALAERHQLCCEIFRVLGRIDHPESKPVANQILINAMAHSHPVAQSLEGQQAIALSLGYLQQPTALETLIRLLATPEPSVRFHVVAALKQLSPDAAHQRLKQLITAPDLSPDLQTGVAIALREWVA
jgi:HEAT repeat protein